MATDQAIMEAVGDKIVPPTLRFYAWLPACLSLGYMQKFDDVNIDLVLAKGWDVVRRPTGGRAILHTDELTYSICFPQDHPLVQGDIVTSYRRLSAALQLGVEKLGLATETAPYEKRSGAPNPICFETPSAYEITLNGKKLIGSAQVRRQKAVLQHGSLPLKGDIARICDALAYPDEATREASKEAVRQRATTLKNGLGREVRFDEVAAGLASAFEETFALTLEETELTDDEIMRIETLKYDTYGSEAWTLKR